MSNLNNERASDTDIQQIIDSTEKGTTMFVASWAFYLMAKELKAARKTLTHLSYTWTGGEQWKPPLGLPPSYISNDRAELQEYRKASSEPVAWKAIFKLDDQPGSNFDKIFESKQSMNDVVSLHELGGFQVSATPLYAAPPLQAVPTKEHELRELVNELRDIAVKYRDTQQLREHIAKALRAAPPQQ